MNALPTQAASENIPQPHRSAAVRFAVGLSVSLSILAVLIVATELASIGILSYTQGAKPANFHQSYYRNQPWAADFWREESLASPKHFSPFVIWRRSAFHGKYVNVEEDGLRRTINADCTPEAKRVWIFGSSTLWGTGAPDDQTIPSWLSREYSQSISPVCVTNYSEAGWVSMQNVIQLEIALKNAARPPDLVLFDDGYADVFAVYESGRADVHMDFDSIRHIVEGGLNRRSSFAYLTESGTYRFLTSVMNNVARLNTSGATARPVSRNVDDLAAMTVRNYRENLKLIDSLATGYGFQYTAFWGPVLLAGKKPLSRPERGIHESSTQSSPQLEELTRKTYALMFSTPHPHVIDISDTFDSASEDLYLDLSHVNPDGNRMIALRMVQALKSYPQRTMAAAHE